MAPERKTRKRGTAQRAGTIPPNGAQAKQLPLPPPFAPGSAEAAATAEPPRILTIGHSSHEAGAFLDLLRRHEVQTLVDVRSAPYSRYAPHFNRNGLAALLDAAGMRYVWCGDSLGGRPDDPDCYRDGIVRRGHVDYAVMAQKHGFQEGVRQLMETAMQGTTVVMCSEEDPRRCHRHRLLEPALRDLGATVHHIRKDGSLETIDPEESGQEGSATPQLVLAGFA